MVSIHVILDGIRTGNGSFQEAFPAFSPTRIFQHLFQRIYTSQPQKEQKKNRKTEDGSRNVWLNSPISDRDEELRQSEHSSAIAKKTGNHWTFGLLFLSLIQFSPKFLGQFFQQTLDFVVPLNPLDYPFP